MLGECGKSWKTLSHGQSRKITASFVGKFTHFIPLHLGVMCSFGPSEDQHLKLRPFNRWPQVPRSQSDHYIQTSFQAWTWPGRMNIPVRKWWDTNFLWGGGWLATALLTINHGSVMIMKWSVCYGKIVRSNSSQQQCSSYLVHFCITAPTVLVQ